MMSSIKSHFILDFFLLLSLMTSLTTAHNAGGATAASECTTSEVPSVFLNDKNGSLAQGNIGLGFGLTAIAAAACAIGSMAPFIDTVLARFPYFDGFRITESKGFLSAALALASGVLLFLTLGDLFPEAISSFGESGWFETKWSRTVATAIFIGTATLIMLFKSIAQRLTPKKTLLSPCLCDPTALECKCHIFETGKAPVLGLCGCEVNDPASAEDHNHEQREHERMKRLGIQVAIALAIHNFPEGLSTFAATIVSPRIGIVYAIALSLHKFPEGLIISVPIYCATGSRWLAFLIAATAGVVSQMLGAVLGYVLLVTYYNQAVSGILFSIVTASLIYVIVHNMLPMARRYDPEDRYVTTYTFIGLFFFGIVASIFDLA